MDVTQQPKKVAAQTAKAFIKNRPWQVYVTDLVRQGHGTTRAEQSSPAEGLASIIDYSALIYVVVSLTGKAASC